VQDFGRAAVRCGSPPEVAVWALMSALADSGRAAGSAWVVITGSEQVQQIASLLDDLVGALLKNQRHVEAERLGGLEVDH
jgi:hypothetical protein